MRNLFLAGFWCSLLVPLILFFGANPSLLFGEGECNTHTDSAAYVPYDGFVKQKEFTDKALIVTFIRESTLLSSQADCSLHDIEAMKYVSRKGEQKYYKVSFFGQSATCLLETNDKAMAQVYDHTYHYLEGQKPSDDKSMSFASFENSTK